MDINLHATSRRTHVSSTGNVENYEIKVISDKPLFHKTDTDWSTGSYNNRMSNAIELLLINKTCAGGQGGPICAEYYPAPNDAGCYVYVFKTTCYCD